MNTDRRKLLLGSLGLIGGGILSSCASDKHLPFSELGEEYQKKPFIFFPDPVFLSNPKEDFSYEKENKIDHENMTRSTKGLAKHRPQVKAARNRHEFFIDFKREDMQHPHKADHYWTWLEIATQDGRSIKVELPEPDAMDDFFYGQDGKDFRAHFAFQSEVTGWIRIRVCCQPHWVFLDYQDTKQLLLDSM